MIDQHAAAELAGIRAALDRLAAVAQQAPLPPQCSVELSADSKGNVKPIVKCFGATVEEAAARAEAAFDRLMAKYGSVAG